MEHHPVLGSVVGADTDRPVTVYTRTIILWGVGLTVDTDRLWEHMNVAVQSTRPRSLVLSDTLRFEQPPPPAAGARKRSRGVVADLAPGSPVVMMMILGYMVFFSSGKKMSLYFRIYGHRFRERGHRLSDCGFPRPWL